jgi:hypothetical protein
MPDGKMRTFYCGDDQTWSEVIQNVVLPIWQEYCNDHWIDHTNHESMWSFEKRTKAFLDRVAWLLLQDNPSGEIESNYKAMSHRVREIPASECPSDISDRFYSQRIQPTYDSDENQRFNLLIEKLDAEDKRPKRMPSRKKVETRFDRMSKICKKYPTATRTWCSVDAENNFVYLGVVHHIPDEIESYSVNNEKNDSMDRVLVIDDGKHIWYYDQNVFPFEQTA